MLEQVRIQNFKSLKDVTLDLQKVNLLIGPNNSGKSNFLKALELISELVPRKKDISIKLRNNNVIRFKHKDGEITFFIKAFKQTLQIQTKSFYSDWEDSDWEFNEQSTKWPNYSNEIINKIKNDFNNFYDRCKSLFNSVVIYRPNPVELLKPFPLIPNQEYISSDASNLIAFFDNIRDKNIDCFDNIERGLQICIPEFKRIVFENIPPTEELKKKYGDKTFKRFGLLNSEQNQIYWAEELSEGVLYLLALLCIVHQPNPPKILLLEEPEKGIHPRRIREVMNFIFQLAEQTDIQVILTSHSEHVLEDFATSPEAVFIFDKDEEGATYVKNLKKDIIEPSHKSSKELGIEKIDFTTNIGENWFMGLMGGVPI